MVRNQGRTGRSGYWAMSAPVRNLEKMFRTAGTKISHLNMCYATQQQNPKLTSRNTYSYDSDLYPLSKVTVNIKTIIFDKGYRLETSYTSLLAGTGFFLVLFPYKLSDNSYLTHQHSGKILVMCYVRQ